MKKLLCVFLLTGRVFAQQPNIVLIMADDMGFSDIGCYGGEIPTPNLDALAENGIRFTQFYNSARCCPTRASLLTGLHPHQTGVGHMTEEPANPQAENWGTPGYQGYLNQNCVTIAEALKPANYHTYMAGKWHLGMHGEEKWPLQRGFEQYYGILAGAASYFKPQGPRGLTYNNTRLPAPSADYYTTDAFTDSAVAFTESQRDGRPFFLYLAFNAPHWPLQAKEADIKKFAGIYEKGWDLIREERLAKQKSMKLFGTDMKLSERDTSIKAWKELTATEKKEVACRMAVYAAQVSSIDENIGKLIHSLKKQGKFENTVIIFLSDNGACPEPYKLLGGGAMADINNGELSGAISYGTGWANASNTPYRKWKREMEEGGIKTPLIIHWPKGIAASQRNKFVSTPSYLPDVMPTVLELAKAVYPSGINGRKKTPLEGRSMVPVLQGKNLSQANFMYWEHEGNQAVRKGDWKAVKDGKNEWQLFNLASDRMEEKDLATTSPAILKELTDKWEEWARSHAVLPKRAGAKPNVLLLMVDDLNDYVSLLNNYPGITTPNLNRIAKSSVNFTKAYCAAPVCNPSRAAILSGLAPNHTGVYDNDNPINASPQILSATFLPELFKSNGYRTLTRGKIFHTVPPEQRYHAMWDVDGGKGDYGPYPTEKNVPADIRRPENFNYQEWKGPESEHPDNVTADFAIRHFSDTSLQPFFSAIGLYKPHNPWTAPQRFFDLFPLDKIVMPKVMENDWDDLPPLAKEWASNPVDYDALKKSGKWKNVVRSYLACIAFMDWNLGRIMDALDKSKYRDNTIVCISADNGFHMGEKKHFAKFALWEQSTHVLHLWRVPGVTKPASTCDRPVTLLNIYPTLVELCGLQTPKQQLDGRSIVNLLKDPSANSVLPAVTIYKERNQTIRTASHRYIRYNDGTEELYDELKDPAETKNLAGDASMQAILASFRKQVTDDFLPAAKLKNTAKQVISKK